MEGKRIESNKERPYHEELVRTLNLPPEQVQELVTMFRDFCLEKKISLDNDTLVVRGIRQFLRESKPSVRQHFGDSLLGQTGCFPFSVKGCILAASCGVETRIARSEKPSRALHTLIVREDGRPFDLTEPTQPATAPMSLGQLRAYARFVQPVNALVDTMRGKPSSLRKTSEGDLET